LHLCKPLLKSEAADRIHINHLGRRLCIVDPKQTTMPGAVALVTGADKPPPEMTH
jgi:fructose transport system ATP-binding protein